MRSSASHLFRALAFLPLALPAATQVQTSLPVNVTAAGVDFTFAKFDVTQGTLTGIQFELLSSHLGGSFSITTSSAINGGVTYRGTTSSLSVLGAGIDFETSAVAVSSSGVTGNLSISRNRTQGFSILSSPQQDLLSSGVVSLGIPNVYFADYSAQGYETLSIAAAVNAYHSITASVMPSVNNSGLAAPTVARLTYTYDLPAPVPEPSVYGLFLGALSLAVVAVRRRRRA